MVNLLLWSVATACALAVLYGLYEATNGHPVTVPVSAFYNAVNRQVWAACVAWVVVACVTGNGGKCGLGRGGLGRIGQGRGGLCHGQWG